MFNISVFNISLLIQLARCAFFAALVFTFYSAVIPPAHAVQLVPWDKAEHFIAFYALTGLGVAAFPRGRIWVIAAMLSRPWWRSRMPVTVPAEAVAVTV